MLLQSILNTLVTQVYRVPSLICCSLAVGLPTTITKLYQSRLIALRPRTQPLPNTYLLVPECPLRLQLLHSTLVVELHPPQHQLVPPQHLLVPPHRPHVLVVLLDEDGCR